MDVKCRDVNVYYSRYGYALSVRSRKRKSREPSNHINAILQRQGVYQVLSYLTSLKSDMYLSINSFNMHEMEYTCISMHDKFVGYS